MMLHLSHPHHQTQTQLPQAQAQAQAQTQAHGQIQTRGQPQAHSNQRLNHNSSGQFPPHPAAVNFPVYHTSPAIQTPHDKLTILAQEIYPRIQCKRYSTLAIDPQRTYLTVYEYEICRHWIIWDFETGYVHLTGIWKAALASQATPNTSPETDTTTNNNGSGRPLVLERAPGRLGPVTPSSSRIKADIFKLLESTPREYQLQIKRIRGGFLKIQGTWLPYQLCRVLCSRFCWNIRFELIPLFGSDFPSMCLNPSNDGYGELRLDIDRSLLPPPPLLPPQSVPVSMTPAHVAPQFHQLAPSPAVASLPIQQLPQNHYNNTTVAQIDGTGKTVVPVQMADSGLGPSPMVHDSQLNLQLYNYILPKSKSKEPKVTKKRRRSSSKKEKKVPFNSTLNTSPLSVQLTPTNNYTYGDLQWDRSNLSTNEITDILNASRCLQFLRKGGYETLSPIEATRHHSLEISPKLQLFVQMTPPFDRNYTATASVSYTTGGTSPPSHSQNITDHYTPVLTRGSDNDSFNNDVSNILMAADTRTTSIPEPKMKPHSRNLSINDLLT